MLFKILFPSSSPQLFFWSFPSFPIPALFSKFSRFFSPKNENSIPASAIPPPPPCFYFFLAPQWLVRVECWLSLPLPCQDPQTNCCRIVRVHLDYVAMFFLCCLLFVSWSPNQIPGGKLFKVSPKSSTPPFSFLFNTAPQTLHFSYGLVPNLRASILRAEGLFNRKPIFGNKLLGINIGRVIVAANLACCALWRLC